MKLIESLECMNIAIVHHSEKNQKFMQVLSKSLD